MPSSLPSPAPRPPRKVTTAKVTGPRSLPENPAELDEEIRPYKIFVRPIVQGLSKVSTVLGAEKFDAAETEGGVQALAALAYQERAEMNAYWLVALWSVSVGAPRVISAMADYEERKAKRGQPAPYVAPEIPAREPDAQTLTLDREAFLQAARES